MITQESAVEIATVFRHIGSCKTTPQLKELMGMDYNIVAAFSGNQAGKTWGMAYMYFLRVLGIHPVERLNKLARKIRCMSPSLPEPGGFDDQDNTQYVEFKKMLPPELIERDITNRSRNLIVRRPDGSQCVIEFRSHHQEMQDLGRIQLSSVWHDEETPRGLRDECKMRLLAEGGDEQFSLTPTNALCVDEKTEILTNRGWKKYNTILMSDKVQTYNIEKDRMEWKPLTGFYLNEYSGKMVELNIRSFNALVTPEHKWVVGHVRKPDFLLKETKYLNSKNYIKRISKNVKSLPDNPYYTDEFIKLVGWIATDGSIYKSHLVIYQSETANKEKSDIIDSLLKKYPGDYKKTQREYGDTIICGRKWEGSGIINIWSISGHLRLQLSTILSLPKHIDNEFICSLSKRQLGLLWESMILGDGYTYENGAVILGQTHNKDIVDDFALIGTLLGRIVTVRGCQYGRKPGYIARAVAPEGRLSEITHYKSMERKIVDYNGFIWCPSTENKTFVMRRNGYVSITGNSYCFDEIWDRAEYIYRTPTIQDVYNLPEKSYPNEGTSIGCVQMATDDNPTLDPESVEFLFQDITDPDELAIRRYGVFKQISGRVHKTYDPRVCYIKHDEIPERWLHCIGIDYHDSRTPWSIGWMSCSPDNEWFLWQEFHPAIDGTNAYNTYEIAKAILRKSGDYQYNVCLIDPLANTTQASIGMSTTEELNLHLRNIHEDTGVGTRMFFEPWNTKGTTGRDQISMRFKNSRRCHKPFNNKIIETGKIKNIPTLWITHDCPKFNKSISSWTYGEYVTAAVKAVNDPKPVPKQKHSHDNMVLECLAKDPRVARADHLINNPPKQVRAKNRSIAGR